MRISRTGQWNATRPLPGRGTPLGCVANRVRADFIRFLALGGDEEAPIHEKGVQLRGAFITGAIDLDYAECQRPLRLIRCDIDGLLSARNARLIELSLAGSRCLGAVFDDARFAGSVYLNDGFECAGGIRFTGAIIEGDLDGGDFACVSFVLPGVVKQCLDLHLALQPH